MRVATTNARTRLVAAVASQTVETLRVLGFDVIPAAVGVETSIATANASTARWNTRRITNAFWRVPVFRNDA